MRIETATEPGTPERPNEDFVSVALPAAGHGGCLVLLDGVTPPADATGCVHSVPWYVAGLGGALIELSVSRPDMTLGECLATAIDRVVNSHSETCDLSHPRTPQATVVLVRWNADTVDHLVLSDSVLLLAAPDGAITPVLDDRLGHLPEPLPSMRAELRELPRGSAQRVSAAAEYGRAVEALRNADGGFFTAAADPSVAARAVTGATPRAAVLALAALTDGAARLVDGFADDDWPSTFALLRKQGAAELIRRVRAAESADPDGTRYPRWKTHDDATAVLAEL
jgi:hypothetical protein